ncbi:MAG TPA: LEA type 2 family protein [Thermoanaerobaculia bacterium]|nr:LEA type 2 family protein [Thermoanaerobaculia bacterium]
MRHPRRSRALAVARPLPVRHPSTVLLLAALLVVLLSTAGCAELLQTAGIQEPRVSLDSTRLTSLSLSDVDLLLGFRVDNPNSVGVSFDRFDYRLSVAGTPLAEGDQRRGVTLAAGGASTVEIPLSVAWSDLSAIYRSLRGGGDPGYSLEAGFWFDVPVLGAIRVPVSTDGSFPRLSMPRLSLASLDVERLTASGAELALQLELENPNDFAFTVNDLDYRLALAGETVAGTAGGRGVRVASGGTERWTVPLSVDFLRAGQALARALSGGGRLDYRLDGTLDLSSTNPWLRSTRVPVDQSGRVSLR